MTTTHGIRLQTTPFEKIALRFVHSLLALKISALKWALTVLALLGIDRINLTNTGLVPLRSVPALSLKTQRNPKLREDVALVISDSCKGTPGRQFLAPTKVAMGRRSIE